MQYLAYLIYRAFVGIIERLPITVAYRVGQVLGWLGWALLFPYRRLAIANLTIAYGKEKSAAEIRALARESFLHLGANLLSSIRAARFNLAEIQAVTTVENRETIERALESGRGVVLVLSHLGNWELIAQLCQYLPQFSWSTIYRPLGNKFIEAHVRRARSASGVVLFDRKSGFNAPTQFLRAGGAVGVLVDQHAGDGGIWTPFFGRLASTTNLAALLALRTGAALVPLAVYTDGPARWRVVISPLVETNEAETGDELGVGDLTARISAAVERQVRVAPADWFWVHNRWKTPKPKFLLATYRRGIVIPAAMSDTAAVELKPFRVLVRSTNWLGDAVMAIPAVQAIARGRPDAGVTVLAPAKLADLWRAVPEVAEVLTIEPHDNVFAVAKTVRRAGPFDAAVLLPNSLRSALEVWLARVPRRVGYAGHGGRRRLLNQLIKERPTAELSASAVTGPVAENDSDLHERFRFLEIARAIGAEIDPVLSTPVAAPSSRSLPGGLARFALCPGAEYGPTKRWPAERFAEAARRVAAARPCEWVLLGTEKERALGEEIERVLTTAIPEDGSGIVGASAPCDNRIGKTTLGELIAILRGCQLLLTNDTGTMHLAAWLGVPVVAIFGSTEPRLTGPISTVGPGAVRVLRRQVECSPCFLRECPLDLRCMTAISAEEVAAAVLEIAAHRPQAASTT